MPENENAGMNFARRREERHFLSAPIECEPTQNHTVEEFKAISVNVSDSGMCFYTNSDLYDGLSLKITSARIWDAPRMATVRWCRKLIEGLYMVGVSLTPEHI
jgi:hypothetical protein